MSIGADAADARHHIGHLTQRASAQKRFKEARRLLDLPLDVLPAPLPPLAPPAAFALDARQRFKPDCAGSLRHCHIATFSSFSVAARNSTAQLVYPFNSRMISSRGTPRANRSEEHTS